MRWPAATCLGLWVGEGMLDDLYRRWLQRRAPAGPLRDYLARPLFSRSADYRKCEFLALDFETTGLDARRDRIVSVGWVVVRGGRVHLDQARHTLVRSRRSVAQSAAVHGLLDSQIAQGAAVSQLVPELLDAMSGRVLLAHCASIELDFLKALCRRLYGVPLTAQVVDTMALEMRRKQRRNESVTTNVLRLHHIRARYGLPRYRAHHALSDAVATAELFLTLAADMAGEGPLPLRYLLS